MPLTTDRQVLALKPGLNRYEKTVAGARGLLLLVYPSGAKSWVLRYVAPNGERRRLQLGPYPGLGLADAREKAAALRVDVVDGEDPAAQRAAERSAARTGETMEDLWNAYAKAAAIGLHGGKGRPKRASTQAVEKNRWEKHIAPQLRARRFVEIKRDDIRTFMRELATSGLSPSTVASVGTTLSAIFAFAVNEDRIEANPTAKLTRPLAIKDRERRFSDGALKQLLSVFRDAARRQVRKPTAVTTLPTSKVPPVPSVSRVERVIGLALEFTLLTLCRRSEAAGARWDEIDLATRTWTIPADRTKAARVHVVPLSDSAIRVLYAALRLQLNPEDHPEVELAELQQRLRFVFPSPGASERHVDAHALTRAVSRLCAEMKLPAGSVHDFRRSGATTLTTEKYGIRRFVVSKVLAHAANDGASAVTGIYDRNDYLPEKRGALAAWARHLEELLGHSEPDKSNVIPIRTEAAA